MIGTDSPLDADHENELRLSGHVVRSFLLAQACKPDLLALCIAVLLHVLLGTLEDNTALLFLGLFKQAVSAKPTSDFNARAEAYSSRRFSPERWLTKAAALARRPSRMVGIFHHHRPSISLPRSFFGYQTQVCLTFRFLSSSAERSSRCFSWLLRFFNKVSGTRIWSWVGTVLQQQQVHCQYSLSAIEVKIRRV